MAQNRHSVNIKFNTDIKELAKAEKRLERVSKLIKATQATRVMTGTETTRLNQMKMAEQKLLSVTKDLRKEQEAITRQMEKQAKTANQMVATQRKEDARRSTIAGRTKRALGQSFLEAPLYSVSFAAMAGIASAIQQFVEFDKVLTRIGIVADRSADSMKKFKDFAIETGRALGTTGKAFAEASLIFIQQGGLAADNAAALAEASIKLANITGTRSEDTSDYITAIANSFSLLEKEGSRAGERIVDMLAELDAATGTSADEIANAFKKSASSFAEAGFTMEEAAAIIAVVSETTRQAPELIGTGMKTLIGNLSEIKVGSKEFEGITNKLQDVTKQFGLSFSLIDEYTGDIKDARTLLEELAELYPKIGSQAAKNAIIEAVAGKEQRDRFIALISNYQRINEVALMAENSTGAAQKANDRYLDSITAKVEILKADVEAFVDSILNTDAFKNLLDQTSRLIRNFTLLIENGNGFYEILTRIGSILIPLASMKALGSIGGISAIMAGQGAMGGTGSKGGNLFTSMLGGGAYASATPEQREKLEKGKVDAETRKAILARQTSRAVGGAGIAGALAIPGILSTINNEDLTKGERTVGVVGQLLPAIGALFGPIGILVGLLGSMVLSFKSVNKEAAQVRSDMKQMQTQIDETFETSGDQIKELVKVVSSPAVDKNSYAYIQASNKLAELLPAMSIGQDAYGNAILRDTEYLTKLVELKNKELELEKQKQTLQLPNLIENAAALQEQSLAAGTGKGKMLQVTRGQSVRFTQEQLLSGTYKQTEEYLALSEKRREALDEEILKMRENDIQAELYGLQVQTYGEKLLGFYAEVDKTLSPEKLVDIQRGMQAVFSGQEDIQVGGVSAKNRIKDILGMDPEKQAAAYAEFYKEFAVEFAKTGKKLGTQDEYIKSLSSGFTSNFQQFLKMSKKEREELLDKLGFKKEDYYRVVQAVLGNTEALQKAFEGLTQEQQKMMIDGKPIAGISNPLQDLFDGLGELDGSQAQRNLKSQFDGIVNVIRNSKKPLAQQYTDMLNIQLDFLAIQNWLSRVGTTLDQAEITELGSMNLKSLDVDLQNVTTLGKPGEGALDVQRISESPFYQSRMLRIRPKELLGTIPTGDGEGAKRDIIAETLAMFDLQRALREKELAEARKYFATLTREDAAYAETQNKIRQLEATNAQEYLKENDLIIEALKKLKVPQEDRIRLEEALVKVISESATLLTKPEQLQLLKARAQMLVEGSEEYNNNLKEQIKLNQDIQASDDERIKILEMLRAAGTATKDQLEELNQKYAENAARGKEIEEAQFYLFSTPYIDRITDANEAVEDQEALLGTLTKSSDDYLEVSDKLIQSQMDLLNAKVLYLQALEADNDLTEEQKQQLEDLRDEIFQLSDAIKKSATELALDKFYKAMYGEADLNALKERYDINLRYYDDLINAQEEIIEKSRLQLEIQQEIESSTDATYKANLKYLETKLKDTKLTNQQITAIRSQIGLLKALSAAAGPGEAQQFRLTRTRAGTYRFAPSGKSGSTAEKKAAALEAATTFEQQAVDEYRKIADQIFAAETQAALLTSQGRTGEAATLTQLAGSLRGQLGAQASEVERAKVVSALVQQGQLGLASKVSIGQVSAQQAMAGMTPEQRAAIQESINQSKISVLSPEVTSTEKLIFTNEKLIKALEDLRASIGSTKSQVDQFTVGKGVAAAGSAVEAENERRLREEPGFLESEIARANSVIRYRKSIGRDTSAQEAYLNRLLTMSPVTSKKSNTNSSYIPGVSTNYPIPGMESGGYTGNSSGLAILHDKELVLNKMDTENMLKAVGLVRQMPQLRLMPIRPDRASTAPGQNIVINADFPGVSSADEIKRAFASMSNMALQYAYTTKSY